jgi:hypothetical protein
LHVFADINTTKIISVYIFNDAGKVDAALEFDNIIFEEIK